MTEVSGTFFFFFHSLGLASPPQKSSPLTMSSDRQFEKWLEGPPSIDQVRSRLDDYTAKIQDIAQVALDPDSAPFAEAKVKQVRANSKLIQQHLRRTEILAEWLLENIDEAADITPSRQTAETYLEYVSALDLYHRAEEIQEELVALHTRAADTTLRVLDLSLQTLSKETSQMKRKLREMESYPHLVELQQQITELIRKIERIRDKEAQKLEDQKREDALKVQLESVRAAAAAHPHSSSTTCLMWYLSPERTQLLNWDSPDPQLSIVLSGMRGLCKRKESCQTTRKHCGNTSRWTMQKSSPSKMLKHPLTRLSISPLMEL